MKGLFFQTRTPPRWTRPFVRVAVFAAAACLIGGNLILLQFAAWGWMIASYSADDGLAVAIQDTFSGERPCSLCTAIRNAEEENGNAPRSTAPPEKEPLRLLTGQAGAFSFRAPDTSRRSILTRIEAQFSRNDPPEPPPPRG